MEEDDSKAGKSKKSEVVRTKTQVFSDAPQPLHIPQYSGPEKRERNPEYIPPDERKPQNLYSWGKLEIPAKGKVYSRNSPEGWRSKKLY